MILVPSGFLLAAVRHPRYALLSGVAVLTTCFFASSYENAAIERYYIGPVFFAWTWLAILGGAVVDAVIGEARADEATRPGGPLERRTGSTPPRPTAAPVARGARAAGTGRRPSSRSAGGSTRPEPPTWVHRWLDEAFTALEPNAPRAVVVVVLDARCGTASSSSIAGPTSRSWTTGRGSTNIWAASRT